MNINDFTRSLIICLKDQLSDEVDITINHVTKNNGINLLGLIFKEKGINASPTIYINDLYDRYTKGEGIEEITEEVLKAYRHSRDRGSIDVSFFMDYGRVKDMLRIKLVNYDKNIDFLQTVPHIKYLDLAIICYCRINIPLIGNASITVKNDHIAMWKVTREEVLKTARENTMTASKCVIRPLTDVLSETCGVDFLSVEQNCNEIPLYVVTNDERLNGAVYISSQDKLLEIYEYVGSDYVIIPSSVHEVLIFPERMGPDMENLSKMIREVNSTEVSGEEVLSDHAYRYSYKEGVLNY